MYAATARDQFLGELFGPGWDEILQRVSDTTWRVERISLDKNKDGVKVKIGLDDEVAEDEERVEKVPNAHREGRRAEEGQVQRRRTETRARRRRGQQRGPVRCERDA